MLRTRERGAFGSKSSTVKWWNVSSGGVTSITSGPSTFTTSKGSGEYETMTDYVTPSFHERVKRGDIINNEMSKMLTKRSVGDAGWLFRKVYSSGSSSYGEADKDYVVVSYGPPTHLLGLPDLGALRTEVSTLAWSKVLQPTAQMLVTAGEAGKTLGMLRRPLSSLVNLAQQGITRGLKSSGRRGDPKAVSQAFSSAWLEARYGWRPLMLEVDNILEALGKQAQERYTARARRSQSDDLTSTFVGRNEGITIPFTVKTVRKATISAGVLYQHEIPLMDYIWGTRLSDIPLAAWDLVPYSFVVDWFVNVNTFIQAIVPKGEVKYLATWIKEEVETSTLRSSGAATFSDWTTLRSPASAETLITKSVRRIPSIPPPGLVLRSNALASVFSDLRGVDSLALLLQRLK